MLELRDFIVARAEGVEESLAYGMLRYGWGEERIVCHLACQRRHVGVYLGALAELDPTGELSRDYGVGKGCVRLRKGDDGAALKKLLARKIALRKAAT